MKAVFDSFIEAVQREPHLHCRRLRQAVARHVADLASPPSGCRFDYQAAARMWRFAAQCSFSAGRRFAGQPVRLLPWQVFFFGCASGWINTDGTRRFRYWHLWVPRKAGKSELAAIGGLFMLIDDGELQAQVFTAASSERQARMVPTAAWRIAGRLDRDGLRRNKMSDRNPPVVETADGGILKGLPKDMDGSQEGSSPSFAIIDELHAYRTRSTYDALVEGMGARDDAALMVISTAGFILDGIGKEKFDLCCSVLDGTTRQDDLFALIFAAEEDDDWQAPETWRRANPSLGVTVSEPFIASRALEAANTGAEAIQVFKTKQLNIWPSSGETGPSAWIDQAAYAAGAKPGLKPPKHTRAWGGVGVAAGLCAVVVVWRRRKGGWGAAGTCWQPESGDRSDAERVPGPIIPDGTVASWLAEQAQRLHLTVAVDPVRSPSLPQALEREGIDVVTVRRSAPNLAPAMRTFRAAVQAGSWRHDGTGQAQVDALEATGADTDLPMPNGLAIATPLAILNALAVALVDDDGTTMDDIPEW